MNNNFKLPENLPKFDINKIPQDIFKNGKTINDLLKDQPTPFSNIQVQTPDFSNIKLKEEPKLKKGIEGWYERNTGKVTLFFAILSAVFAVISIIEAILLAQK